MRTFVSGSRHALESRLPHLSWVICIRPTSPPPPVTLGLHVDSWSANDASRIGGTLICSAYFSKIHLYGLHGSQTWLLESASSIETYAMFCAVTPSGGVHGESGESLEMPHVSHQLAPFGLDESAPEAPQLDAEKPMRPWTSELSQSSPDLVSLDDDDDDDCVSAAFCEEDDDEAFCFLLDEEEDDVGCSFLDDLDVEVGAAVVICAAAATRAFESYATDDDDVTAGSDVVVTKSSEAGTVGVALPAAEADSRRTDALDDASALRDEMDAAAAVSSLDDLVGAAHLLL